MPRTSGALDKLRAVVILIVVAFHSVIAYVDYLPATPYPFASPPYLWTTFPIIDSARWFGFDLFCAFEDLHLIALMYFLSGLFVWPSLTRKGRWGFLRDRTLRLGLPFALVVGVLTPLAHYATYRVTAADQSFGAFWQHWLALPFWPVGPPWFLSLLLAFDVLAVGLHKLFAGRDAALIQLAAFAARRPVLSFLALAAASALVYVPLALALSPWTWFQQGPITFQHSRPLHYGLYFFAGVMIGARGIERGLLATDGGLVRHWRLWLAVAPPLFGLWMLATKLSLDDGGASLVRIAGDVSFALSCAASCFLMLALFLRFEPPSLWALNSLRANAYGIYLTHYAFVVWLQYLLLGAALTAVVKATLVFSIALTLSWAVSTVIRRMPVAARVIDPERSLTAKA